MNNGHPNYQQPAGGQQPGQGMPQPGQRYAPQGGYSGQAPQGYYPPQGQAPQGYAPQGNPQGYAPQGRAPQGQAPYGYPQGQGGYYGAPSGYGQGQGGNYYPPQGAPAQGQQMPYQGYGQQPYPPQQGYGQGYPGQPYPGMYAQPGQQPKPPAKPFPVELVCKIAVFGLLPVLFILSMIFPIVALKWIFIVLAVAGVTFLWVRPILFSNTRLTLTAVYAAAAVVALVSALMAPPADTSNNAQGNGAMDQNSINETLNQIQDATGETPETGMPLQEVTPTPTASLDNDETVSQLKSFFYFWSVNKTNEMVTLCAASGFVVHFFPTGQGNIIGNPILPVIKLSANPRTVRTMSEHIDVDVSGILRREINLDAAGDKLLEMMFRTCNGRNTSAEVLGHREFIMTRLYESA